MIEHFFPGNLRPSEEGEALGTVTNIRPDGAVPDASALPPVIRRADEMARRLSALLLLGGKLDAVYRDCRGEG